MCSADTSKERDLLGGALECVMAPGTSHRLSTSRPSLGLTVTTSHPLALPQHSSPSAADFGVSKLSPACNGASWEDPGKGLAGYFSAVRSF